MLIPSLCRPFETLPKRAVSLPLTGIRNLPPAIALGSGTGLAAGAVGMAADWAGAALGGFAGDRVVADPGGGRLSGRGWPGAAVVVGAGGGGLARTPAPDGGGSGSAVMAAWLFA